MKSMIVLYAFLIMSSSILTSKEIYSQSLAPDSKLDRSFNLAVKRSNQIQYFTMESKFKNYYLDDLHSDTQIYKANLKCIPSELRGSSGDEYTCTKFTVIKNDSSEIKIPAIEGWKYIYDKNISTDNKGQVFGIDHKKFEKLLDSNGKRVQQNEAYLIYNTFIDYHTFCNVFAEATEAGKGIQDLKNIGDKIIHASAFSKPPVNLGSNISEGSYFQNGEVTLLFKGISLVKNSTCAIIGFDSGESSFKIIMNPAPDMEIVTDGTSHYKGDIYIDLNTFWVRKVIMDEFVLTETKLPFPPNKLNTATERNTTINNLSEEEFNED